MSERWHIGTKVVVTREWMRGPSFGDGARPWPQNEREEGQHLPDTNSVGRIELKSRKRHPEVFGLTGRQGCVLHILVALSCIAFACLCLKPEVPKGKRGFCAIE